MNDTTELLFGYHAVKEAMVAGRRRFMAVQVVDDRKNRRSAEVAQLAQARRIPVKTTSAEQLRTLCQSNQHQGVAAFVSPYPVVDLGQMIAAAKRSPGFILALDSVVDPHNLGALIRTAHCAGVVGVIIPKDRSVGPTPTVSRVSAGAVEHTLLARVTNLARTVAELKKEGFWAAGLDHNGLQSVFDLDGSVPLVLVVGSEEKGLRPQVRKSCDLIVSIPQKGRIDSLNASTAGAIAMYEIVRQRMHERSIKTIE